MTRCLTKSRSISPLWYWAAICLKARRARLMFRLRGRMCVGQIDFSNDRAIILLRCSTHFLKRYQLPSAKRIFYVHSFYGRVVRSDITPARGKLRAVL